MASPKSDNPVGRPSAYDPSYCDRCKEIMALGYSLTAFAGSIGVSRQTVDNWKHEHPEFFDATRTGQALRTLYLEGGLLEAPDGPKVTSRIFALKNSAPEEWREKQEVAHTGADGGPLGITVQFVTQTPKDGDK